MSARLNAVIALCLCASSCATTPNLSGRWQLVKPDGSESSIDITSLRRDEYYLRQPRGPLSGIYVIQDGELQMVRADNPRTEGFSWNVIDNQNMTLVEEASVQTTGEHLISSRLVRIAP